MSENSTSSPALTRLSNIKAHMEGCNSTVFHDGIVPLAPEDPLFGLMAAYRKDDFDKKVDLGIGAYRDNNAQPWVLPVVKKVGSHNTMEIRVPSGSQFLRRKNCFARTPSSITNICQSLVLPTSPRQHRSSF